MSGLRIAGSMLCQSGDISNPLVDHVSEALRQVILVRTVDRDTFHAFPVIGTSSTLAGTVVHPLGDSLTQILHKFRLDFQRAISFLVVKQLQCI